MCGIIAIYAYDSSAAIVDRNELIAIRDYMINRGPDDKGEWFSENGSIGMGHRRLSIIDLSDRASQPMTSANGKLVISFNGEIYNYKSLRKELEVKGCVFQSDSDTEVLLHLYMEYGGSMVHYLRGMFSFILWDDEKQRLLLARDPYGIKPLFYTDDGRTVRIASQVKAILAGGKVSDEKDPAGIVGFYLFGSIPEPYTTHLKIRSVPAGCTVWIDKDGISEAVSFFSIAQIWKQSEASRIEVQNVQEVVKEALLDSVRHHMIADVPVGAFLSAGVDSGALVGLMMDVSPDESIQTVTLSFDEFRGEHEDESLLAEQVARQYGTQHTSRVVTEKEFQEDLPKIIEAMDQPSIDGINTWFVSKAAKELGLKVAISGLGGDELFGGYPSFKDIPRSVRYFGLPSRVPFLGDLIRKIGTLLLTSYSSINPKVLGLIKYGGTYPGAWFLRRGLFMPWELDKLLDRDFVTEGLRKLQPLKHIASVLKPGPATVFGKVAVLESSLYMRNQLLRDADWAGMAHSLEIRLPLVDIQLLQKLAPVFCSTPKPEGKYAFGNSPSAPLPEKIINRKKTGFTIPIDKWIRSNDLFQQRNVCSQKHQNAHWSRQWANMVYSQFET